MVCATIYETDGGGKIDCKKATEAPVNEREG